MRAKLGEEKRMDLDKMDQDGLEDVLQSQIIEAIENDDDPLLLDKVLVKAASGQDKRDNKDVQIREVVLSLDPSHAAKLFHRLWDIFISDRSSKIGNPLLKENPRLLVEWIKWVLVAHGNSKEISQLVVSSHSQVSSLIKGRIEKIPKILTLQGRLSMLSTQIELRQSNNEYTQEDDGDDEDEILLEASDEDDEDITSDDDSVLSGSSPSSGDDEYPTTDGIPELWKNLRQGNRDTASEEEIDEDIPIEDVSHIGGGDFQDEEDDEEEDSRIQS